MKGENFMLELANLNYFGHEKDWAIEMDYYWNKAGKATNRYWNFISQNVALVQIGKQLEMVGYILSTSYV